MGIRKNNKWREKLNAFPEGDVNGDWSKMEALLDKKIPLSNKKDRRYLLLMLLFLILVLGICNYPAWKNKAVDGDITSINKDDSTDKITGKIPESTLNKSALKSEETKEPQTSQKVLSSTETYKKKNGITPVNKGITPDKTNTEVTYTVSQYNKSITSKSQPKSILNDDTGKPDDRATKDKKIQEPDRVSDNDRPGVYKTDTATNRNTLQKEEIQALDTSSGILDNKFTNSDSVIATQSKIKRQATNKKSKFSLGAGLDYSLPVNGQQQSMFNRKGSKNNLSNFSPAIFGRFFIQDKMYLQAEIQLNAPQLTQKILLDRKFIPLPGPSPAGVGQVEKSIFTKKLFYMYLPLSFHIIPFKNVFIGGGLQYSHLTKAVGVMEEKVIITGRPDSLLSRRVATIDDTLRAAFKLGEWRYLADASYKWNRLNVGIRYTKSFQPFLKIVPAGFSTSTTTNSLLSIFLRYELWQIGANKKKKN